MVSENGPWVGRLMPTQGPPPVDISVTWNLSDGRTVKNHANRVEPWRPDLPPGSDLSVHTTLAESPPAKNVYALNLIQSVVVHYSDEQRVGRWRQVWRSAQDAAEPNNYYLVANEPELLT